LTVARRIESLFVAGPAGRIEALLEEPEDRDPIFAALVCHPHPRHGGTMHNKVVYRIARGLRSAGAVVLRFNYRGVNLSEGEYDHGIGETEDARACLSWLINHYPSLPYRIAGFSFGSRVTLRLGCQLPDVQQLLVVGYPTKYKEKDWFNQCERPKVFLHSTQDEHGPLDELRAVVAQTQEPKQLIEIPARDHFFAGALDEFEAAVRAAANQLGAASAGSAAEPAH
jgi:alpha/beta superfamily hydrolase